MKHLGPSPQRVYELSSLVLLLLRRAPRALESGPSERHHHLGVGYVDYEWGRRTTKGVQRKCWRRDGMPVYL